MSFGRPQPGTPAPAATQTTRINFQGPWAFVKDEGHKQLLAIAAEVPGHDKAFIRAVSPGVKLDFGIYDLPDFRPNPPASGSTLTSPSMKTISTSNQQLTTLLAIPSTLKRYVIKLPLPDSIGGFTDEAKIDVRYPPNTARQQYMDTVFLVYTSGPTPSITFKGVSNNNVSISQALGILATPGTTTAAAQAELLISVGPGDFSDDDCDLHAKIAFSTLTALFGNRYYIDFPPYSASCPSPVSATAGPDASAAQHARVRSEDDIRSYGLAKLATISAYLTQAVKEHSASPKLLESVQVLNEYWQQTKGLKSQGNAIKAASEIRLFFQSQAQSHLDSSHRQLFRDSHLILVGILDHSPANCKAAVPLVTIQ